MTVKKIEIRLCPSCGGKIGKERTTFTLDFNKGILIVRGVPTFVCSVCGDKWYSDPVSVKLDSYIQEAQKVNKKLYDDLIITRYEDVA